MFDVVVIGGGVVGLAIARALTLDGLQVAVVERANHLLQEASGGNSGIVCTGVDAEPGSLERALIRDSLSLIRPYCKQHNIPTRPCGSLVCLWNDFSADHDNECESDDIVSTIKQKTQAAEVLNKVLNDSHDAGDSHATVLSNNQLQHDMDEPNINYDDLVGAVHIPGEIVVDPWLYSISLACHARENGCHIYTNYEVDIDKISLDEPSNHHAGGGVWTVPRKVLDVVSDNDSSDISSSTSNQTELKARMVVNACGLWAQEVDERIRKLTQVSMDTSELSSSSCPWKATPRRGQYRIYRSTPSTKIEHPIQPIPTSRTKGVFVFSNLLKNLIVVGPTALDQQSKTDKAVDEHVALQLDLIAKRTIPSLDPIGQHLGDYVGIRPGTNHRDYQIHTIPTKQYVVVAGIRSTGLSASLGIGNYVSRLVRMIMRHYPTGRSVQQSALQTTPMPSIDELVRSYQDHQVFGRKGFVTIHGHKYYVTHPLSRMGFEEMIMSRANN
jgi:glycerol-3-phosphate dehydrogenase